MIISMMRNLFQYKTFLLQNQYKRVIVQKCSFCVKNMPKSHRLIVDDHTLSLHIEILVVY